MAIFDCWGTSYREPPCLPILAPIILVAAACAPAGAAGEPAIAPTAQSEIARDPDSGLELIEVTVVSAEARHTFTTELAASGEAQQRGMMFRTEMGDDEGMLFPSYQAQPRSFWMKNTPLPLDIIFIGPDSRITNIEDGVPYTTDSVSSIGPALAVFEIRGGLSEELGITAGDMVEFELPE